MQIERILILLALVLLVTAVRLGLRAWRARRIAALAAESPFAELLPAGRPAVVAFTTPGCAECRTRQAPALARLSSELGDAVTVRTLTAPEHPALVDRLGVLTVPATAVVDAHGQVRQLNLGFADAARLAEQLRAVGAAPAA